MLNKRDSFIRMMDYLNDGYGRICPFKLSMLHKMAEHDFSEEFLSSELYSDEFPANFYGDQMGGYMNGAAYQDLVTATGNTSTTFIPDGYREHCFREVQVKYWRRNFDRNALYVIEEMLNS